MVVDPEVSKFWQAALRSGLIDAEGLVACLEGIAPGQLTPKAIDRRLARQAVVAGKLTPWQAQQLLLGRWKLLKIDRYRLLAKIGRGGMGEVYLAQDTRLVRHVAMKVLSGEQSKKPRSVARFEREAKIAGRLHDEHLIRVYDFGEASGIRYLVMEYIDGKSTARLLEEHGALPPAVAAELGRQVALGLEYLHREGLLHRDVTPSNMLVDRGGTVKLADLGLAIDLDDAERLTREGSTVGTFDYLSPEQARDSRKINIQSDIYSLGCSLYHMISGSVPFPAPTLPEKLVAHRIAEAESLEDLAPSCSPRLAAVVRRMMRKSPADRYARPADVASALEPFASGAAPLSRIVSMGEATKSESGAASGEAFAVEWFETESEVDVDGGAAAAAAATVPPTSRIPQDIFPRIDVELGLPAAPIDPANATPGGQGWRAGARGAAAASLSSVSAFASRLVRRILAGLSGLMGQRR